MSLIQKPPMTDNNRTAHQRNGRQSRGAATPQGKERSRAAHLRHGFYSQQREEALRALGEDPAELAALIESMRAEWRPTSDFQERLTERMARLWWRTERAERMQESLIAREMQEHQKRRHERVQELRNDCEAQASVLEMLRDYCAQPRFYVPRCLFHHFHLAFGAGVVGRRRRMLWLMHALRPPEGSTSSFEPSGARPSPPRGFAPGERVEAAAEEACAPGASVESGGDEEVSRSGVGATEGCPPGEGAEGIECPSGEVDGGVCEGTAKPTPMSEEQYLAEMQEMEDIDELEYGVFSIPSSQTPIAEGAERDRLREALGILARIELSFVHKEFDPQIEEQEKPLTEIEQDEVQATPHKQAELMRREEGSCFRQFMRLANLLQKMQKQDEKSAKNEGSSGDVDENTGGAKTDRETDCPEPVSASTRGNGQTVRNAGSEVQSPRSEVANGEAEVRNPAFGAAKTASDVEGRNSGGKKNGSEARRPAPRLTNKDFEAQSSGSEVEKGEFDARSPSPEAGTAAAEAETRPPEQVDQAAAHACAA
ncbi:MAG: hypothetical protein ACLQVG_06770 [Terriglobia bacterium]